MRNITFKDSTEGPHSPMSSFEREKNKLFEGGFVDGKTTWNRMQNISRAVYFLYKLDSKFRFWSDIIIGFVLMIVAIQITIWVN